MSVERHFSAFHKPGNGEKLAWSGARKPFIFINFAHF
ncbi:MAG: hypothetical protein JWQ78_1003 [Sediminibacterium sp.]|nr:hypothetical protein [Sediminibacterium sp.]